MTGCHACQPVDARSMQVRCGPGEGGCTCLCRYCARLQAPSFWGGEVEILVLSRMLRAPIYVYRSAQEAGRWACL